MTVTYSEIDHAKQSVREQVWSLLERKGVALAPGAHGRIPNFIGAADAAERLADLPSWKSARIVKAVPDHAQLPVRVRALQDGKIVYMAVPKLADEKPFYLLDPQTLPVPPEVAASSHAARSVARTVRLDEMSPVDLVVCGSVAVNRDGVRLGKGAGYSDIEVALLHEAGLLQPETIIVTTVHSLQVVDDQLPESEHDFGVDMIVTPDEVIYCPSPRRSSGIIWEHLGSEKINAIPVLALERDKRR